MKLGGKWIKKKPAVEFCHISSVNEIVLISDLHESGTIKRSSEHPNLWVKIKSCFLNFANKSYLQFRDFKL